MDYWKWLESPDKAAAKEWTPSELMEPLQVYTEAIEDRKASRYADSLAKLVWFREHALERSSAFAGARNSFALAEWLELGRHYRPAREALLQVRDAAERQVREKPDRQSFADMASVNRCLQATQRVVRIFSELAERSADVARECYPVAERYLLAHGEHRQCNPFLDVERRSNCAWQFYTELIQLTAEENNEEPGEWDFALVNAAYEYLMSEITSLVALLALSDRHEEARHVYKTALAMLSDEALEARLNAALRGELQE